LIKLTAIFDNTINKAEREDVAVRKQSDGEPDLNVY